MSIELKQAAQQALEALLKIYSRGVVAGWGEHPKWQGDMRKVESAVHVLRTAIQQAESEPVGEVFYTADGGDDETGAGYYMTPCVRFIGKAPEAGTKLYTNPSPGVPTLITKQQVMYALAFVPLDLSHPAKCQWIAEALTTAQAQKGK